MSQRYTSRDATPDDYPTFVRLFAELEVPEAPPERAAWEHDFMPSTIFLEDQGAPIAYSFLKVMGDEGYVVHVVVDPERRRGGVGRALMREVADRLRARGCTRWSLNVKVDNHPARRLYEAIGMREAYTSTALRIAWADVARLPEGDRAVIARPLDPAEDAAVERAFGMPQGRLTVQRERLGIVLLRLVDTAAPDEPRVGVAVFAPQFPGAFPFRVARPELARALLEGMRPHALPQHDFVRVSVEDDPALTRALTDAGAAPVMELLVMKGPLP